MYVIRPFRVFPLFRKHLSNHVYYVYLLSRKELIVFLADLTKRLHDPPTWRTPDSPDAHCIMTTCGAQDGQYKVIVNGNENKHAVFSYTLIYTYLLYT